MPRATRRGVAAGAATTLAIGVLSVLGTGVADAAPASITWADGAATFTRTVDNVTPVGDDIVTVTTKWARTNAHWEELWWVKDYHPACLTYVPGSAKVADAAGVHTIEPFVEIQSDFTAVDFTSLGYKPLSKENVDTPVLTMQYKAGYDCARGTNFTTGMAYNGSRGAGTYTTKGPAITVGKNSPTTTLAPVAAAMEGQASTLTATVSGGGAQGDTVEFYDGATMIGTGLLDANRAVDLAWTPVTAGAHTLSVRYLGTAFSNASQSADQQVTVGAAGVASSIDLAPVSGAKVGEVTTLTATVSPAPAGGTVTFKDGATVIGTAEIGAGGTATLEWTPTASGSRVVSVEFSGHATVEACTGQATVTVASADATGGGGQGSLGALFNGFGSSS